MSVNGPSDEKRNITMPPITEEPVQPSFEYDIRVEDPEGNDAWDVTCTLPFCPQVGMSLEVWINSGMPIPEGYYSDDDIQRDMEERWNKSFSTGEPIWLEVKSVVMSTYWPERVEVWVSSDGHSDTYLRRAFLAIERSEQP